jgi:hypothetical protein
MMTSSESLRWRRAWPGRGEWASGVELRRAESWIEFHV